MDSWVRYSVAVYTGLLLAGAAGLPQEAEFERAASATAPMRKAIVLPRALQDIEDYAPGFEATTPRPSNSHSSLSDTL